MHRSTLKAWTLPHKVCDSLVLPNSLVFAFHLASTHARAESACYTVPTCQTGMPYRALNHGTPACINCWHAYRGGRSPDGVRRD